MLPPLSLEEAEHSRNVEALIRRRIVESGGWIDFETFMDLALYAPGLGYYSAGSRKLGPGGDFTTAPESSDIFSACVARQCADILTAVGGGDILEFGAGTGRMAAAVLESLESLAALPARYAILEVSADLKARQREAIGRLAPALRQRVTWLDEWPSVPARGVILANEILDALPCRRFALRTEGVRALGVALAPDGALVECERPADAVLLAEVNELARSLREPLPNGYRSEVCPRAAPWVSGVAQCLERGAVLILDYGMPRAHYYHPERNEGTLRCHFKQRAHDNPLIHVGVQDITAWVDFTRVAEAADACRLQVLGFATQAGFLLGAGIHELRGPVAGAAGARWAGEARRLLLPEEMGEAFKVMALGRDLDAPLKGFAYQDLRHLL